MPTGTRAIQSSRHASWARGDLLPGVCVMSDNADERTTVAASDETTRVKPVVAVVGRPNVGK